MGLCDRLCRDGERGDDSPEESLMSHFFKGWRRKAGCAALVLACGLMIANVRSYMISDCLFFPIGDELGAITSLRGGLDFKTLKVSRERLGGRLLHWTAQPVLKNMRRNPLFDHTVSYLTLVVPATLVSAYLCLWKPRKREKAL